MYYINKSGELFYIGNLQSVTYKYQGFEIPGTKVTLANIYLLTLPDHKEIQIETIDTKKKEGTPRNFISYIYHMIAVEKDLISWKEYLDYKEKVLDTMEDVDEGSLP